jgi:hypothetical protein
MPISAVINRKLELSIVVISANLFFSDKDHVNDPRVLSWSFTASQPG